MFEQITILGPGLIGASLAMAIKKSMPATRVIIWARDKQSRAKCQHQSWCDGVAETPEKAVAGSDLTILCTPVQAIVELLKQIRSGLKKGSLVSDVGSTKAFICNEAHLVFKDTSITFLGAHPMAGSEKTGMQSARFDLFENAACILTPLPDTPAIAVEQMECFWQSIGSEVSSVSPEVHDKIVAHISHLPHVLASTLCAYLSMQDPTWKTLGGGGLRDTTRIASGNTQLWKQILEQNRTEILHSITGFEQQLCMLKNALIENQPDTLLSQLEQGKAYRDQF